MARKSYTINEVLNNAWVGYCFEFYSSKDDSFIHENLNKLTSKNIIITNEPDRQPSFTSAVLVKEYESKKPKYRFLLAQQSYKTTLSMVSEILNWIASTAETTADTGLKMNLSFDHKNLQTLNTISGMDRTKLVLKLDEKFVYDRFVEQVNSPYALSIKKLVPFNTYSNANELYKNLNNSIQVPVGSHYGINFIDQTMGTLEFNYIGGKKYAEKEPQILELFEYFILKTFQSLNETLYTDFEMEELRIMMSPFEKIQECLEPMTFKKAFPDIKVYVDLQISEQLLKTFWPNIKNVLFDAVMNNGFRKGSFNYDSEIGKFQIKRAELDATNMKDMDIIESKISGILERCNLWDCDVNKARIYNSKLVKGNTLTNSYLKNITANNENTIEKCIVENNQEVLNCLIKESVIKFSNIGKNAHLDEGTVVIDKKIPMSIIETGVQIEEIRDYNFIKNMRTNTNNEFQNIYIKSKY